MRLAVVSLQKYDHIHLLNDPSQATRYFLVVTFARQSAILAHPATNTIDAWSPSKSNALEATADSNPALNLPYSANTAPILQKSVRERCVLAASESSEISSIHRARLSLTIIPRYLKEPNPPVVGNEED